MSDINARWMQLLVELDGLGSAEQYIDDILSDDAAWGRANSRAAMSRAGTGGDPLTRRQDNAYDDIDDDEMTLDVEADYLRATH